MNIVQKPLHIVMVVLHTSPLARPGSADAGGLNVVVSSVAKALVTAGHRVSLISRKAAPDMPEEIQNVDGYEGLNAYFLPAGPDHPIAKSKTDAVIEPFSHAFSAWWDKNGHTVDIIHSHHWFAGVAAIPVAARNGVIHVQSYHSVAAAVGEELEAGEQPESQGRIPGEKLCAEGSDVIIAVSDAEKHMIEERYNPSVPIPVSHPGVDTTMFRPLGYGLPHCQEGEAHIRSLTNGKPYLFFAARLQPLKGADLAIDALACIPEEHRPLLVIAGEASEDFAGYENSLHQRARTAGVANHIRYVGSLDRAELSCMIAHSYLMITPSYSETFGIINLEAAACAVPVIAWNRTGLKESVKNGETGILCETRNPEEWAQAILTYLNNPNLREKHGKQGRTWAESRTWNNVAEEYEHIYRTAIGNHQHAHTDK